MGGGVKGTSVHLVRLVDDADHHGVWPHDDLMVAGLALYSVGGGDAEGDIVRASIGFEATGDSCVDGDEGLVSARAQHPEVPLVHGGAISVERVRSLAGVVSVCG